ncbi:glycosyltransferase [Idiomarina sp. A28L]|uniref:glycosyltransferase n=1 Tax=Idiomarina sp. A28L TaxID=1036674 RepID=UPI0002138CBB|nr:glycosyltransferase [Idiomarina sp. A28L]EGN74611.1 glycosyltransferase [Idiomarina sp. A28L]
MHILILPSWYPKHPSDVTGVFFRDQGLALQKHGHHVGVIAPQLETLRTLFKKTNAKFSLNFELDDGMPTYRHPLYAFLPRLPYGNYILFKWLAKRLIKRYIAEQGKPDIIHAHSAIYAGAVAAELSHELKIPFIVTEHSSGFARKLYASWQVKLAKKAFTQAKKCIAVSPELSSLLETQIPHTRGQWTWIPNMVADRFNQPSPRDTQSRSIRFLNLAMMNDNKGQADLINAFKQVVEDKLQSELWLAGDGALRTNLEQQTQYLGIADKVRFLGMVPPAAVPGLLEEVDVMVVSSHYETFGVVAAEALMAGVPVIATRCGGPECIVTEADGILVPIKEPQALGQAMFQLAQNIANYDPVEISKHARARFSGEAVAEQLTKLYRSVFFSRKNDEIALEDVSQNECP